jgi:hypothetical protein
LFVSAILIESSPAPEPLFEPPDDAFCAVGCAADNFVGSAFLKSASCARFFAFVLFFFFFSLSELDDRELLLDDDDDDDDDDGLALLLSRLLERPRLRLRHDRSRESERRRGRRLLSWLRLRER